MPLYEKRVVIVNELTLQTSNYASYTSPSHSYLLFSRLFQGKSFINVNFRLRFKHYFTLYYAKLHMYMSTWIRSKHKSSSWFVTMIVTRSLSYILVYVLISQGQIGLLLNSVSTSIKSAKHFAFQTDFIIYILVT